jgi:type IX secretion system PorP/SprF family membrane protein
MKRKLLKGIGVLSLTALSLIATAQDPEVTQFYATPVYTNPAMAGTAFCQSGEPGGRFAINYRNQWPSLPGTFRTIIAGWDQHFESLGGGLGIMFTKDVAGTGKLTRTTMHFDYSYLIQAGRSTFIRLGLEAAYFQQSIDYARLKFGDQIDPTQGFVNPTGEVFSNEQKSYPNFSTGALVYTKNFYGGVAIHNITEPNQSFEDDPYGTLPRRYTAHTGVVIPLDNRRVSKSTISPNALFMMQNNFTQINLGFYLNKGPLVTGLWFRQSVGEAGNSDALMALIGFRKDRFKFGYSYDITVSSARSAVPGSHEVSAAVDWCLPRTPIRFRPLRCPDF